MRSSSLRLDWFYDLMCRLLLCVVWFVNWGLEKVWLLFSYGNIVNFGLMILSDLIMYLASEGVVRLL